MHSAKEAKKNPWQKQYSKYSTIFGKETYLPIDFDKALNDNTLVVGTSGTGKTYSFLEPNLLQGSSNYIVADAKGNILSEIGPSLKKMGYNLQVLNLVDLQHSMTFNPLINIGQDTEIISFAQQIMTTRVDGKFAQSSHEDPFWQNAAMTLLEALIFFIKDELPEEEQTMVTVNKLFTVTTMKPSRIDEALKVIGDTEKNYYFDDYDEDNDDRVIGDYLFDWVRANDPMSTSVKMWEKVRAMANSPHTWASVIGILGADIAIYSMRDIEALMSSNQIDFSQFLQPKTALFILYDDADNSKNFISNLLYSQLINYLYHESRNYPHQSLPVKIRFFLDDFKNINIPNFEDRLATALSRNISFCMLLQDESQLKAKFGPSTPSVIGDCAAYLLTGTTDLMMANIAANRFNMTSKAIRRLDPEHFLLDISGYTISPLRYDYHDHPHYAGGYLDLEKQIKPQRKVIELRGLQGIMTNLPHECDHENFTNDLFGDDVVNFE